MTLNPLSDDARSHINEMDSEAKRGLARGWAGMDPQLFQVKIGMAIEEIDEKLDKVLNRSSRQPAMPAFISEMSPVQKTTIASFIGAVILYVIANWPA